MHAKDISKKIKCVKRDKQKKESVHWQETYVRPKDTPNGEKQSRYRRGNDSHFAMDFRYSNHCLCNWELSLKYKELLSIITITNKY